MKKLGDSHYAKSIRGKVFRSSRLLQICTAVIVFAGSAGLHSASAQQIDPSSVSDDLACKSEAEKGLSDVDKSIEEKSKNGFDPEKLAKIKAKRQELYDRNFRSCIEIKSANRLSAKADADIAKADADIAKADADIAKADADIAEYKRRQAKADADIAKADADIAKADADIAKADADIAKADEMIARVERIKNAREKLDKTRIQVEAIVNDMQKGPVGMERMNSLLYDLGPKFLAEAKVYLRELKPIIPEDQFRVMESKLKIIESSLPASIQR